MLFSDLIDDLNDSVESSSALKSCNTYSEKIKYKSYIDRYFVKTEKDVEFFHKNKGKYSLINKIDYFNLNTAKINYYSKIFSSELNLILDLIKKKNNILVVGLGNEDIESDSLGGLICDKLSKYINYFNGFYIFKPNVFGKTGFESFDVVKELVKMKKIDVVIVLDSLCATNYKRLCSSIQLTNSGISPGSGVKNNRKKFVKNELGCEVIAIGVPLMIYSSSLIDNFFEEVIFYNNLKISNRSLNKIKKYEENTFSTMIVSPSNIGQIVENFANIIYLGISKSLLKLVTSKF